MGCGDSAETKGAIKSIDEQFAELRLQNLLIMPFESELEEKIFKAVNVCRAVPGRFSMVVKQVKRQFPVAKHAKHTHLLIKSMEKM